jgi:hypothetical protein
MVSLVSSEMRKPGLGGQEDQGPVMAADDRACGSAIRFQLALRKPASTAMRSLICS